MPDWIGSQGDTTARRYRLMAERETRGISPSYEAICLGVAGDAELLARLDALPPPKRQPNLLLGAVRFLGGGAAASAGMSGGGEEAPVEEGSPDGDGSVSSWAEFRALALDRWDEIAATMLARRTQTNEPGRCASLLPVLAALPQPLALLEVGASAGLCLYPDRYSYRYESATGLHRVGAGAAELRCAVTGPVPLPTRPPDVVWRCGLDLNPLVVGRDEDVRWLQSLIWPEQTRRFEVLRDAVAIARADPPTIVSGDLTTDLAAVAASAPPDVTLVVFHSAVLAYVPLAGRSAFADAVGRLAEVRPTVWLSNEAPGVVAGTEVEPSGPARFVLARDGRPLARTGPHGQSLDWLPV
ncbi:MAG: DUF2332 domain-containing protein [Jatrophihabitantaceae bacterium]